MVDIFARRAVGETPSAAPRSRTLRPPLRLGLLKRGDVPVGLLEVGEPPREQAHPREERVEEDPQHVEVPDPGRDGPDEEYVVVLGLAEKAVRGAAVHNFGRAGALERTMCTTPLKPWRSSEKRYSHEKRSEPTHATVAGTRSPRKRPKRGMSRMRPKSSIGERIIAHRMLNMIALCRVPRSYATHHPSSSSKMSSPAKRGSRVLVSGRLSTTEAAAKRARRASRQGSGRYKTARAGARTREAVHHPRGNRFDDPSDDHLRKRNVDVLARPREPPSDTLGDVGAVARARHALRVVLGRRRPGPQA